MGKKLRFFASLYAILLTVASVSGEGLITPPEGLTEEIWMMKFENYRRISASNFEEEQRRNVVFVWDDNEIYIKGVFLSYPDAWIKAVNEDGNIKFQHPQLIAEENGKQIYFNCGTARYSVDSGNTFFQRTIAFYTSDCKFKLWGFEDSIISSDIDNYANRYGTAFWYNDDPKRVPSFCDGYDLRAGKPYGEGFPDIDYIVRIRFYKTDDTGIDDIQPDADEPSGIVYDLQGRRMQSDRLSPGIYVRNGRKFIVR